MGMGLLTQFGIAASNVVGFSPGDISGLNLWCDADDSATITETANAVSLWDDKSGEGNHLAQNTGSLQPITNTTTQNGRNVLDFNADRIKLLDFVGGPLSQPNTIFIVYKYDDLTDNARIFDGGRTGSERHILTQNNNGANTLLFQAGLSIISPDLGSISTFQQVRCVVDSSSSEIFRNGVSVVSGDAGTNVLDGFTAGATYDGAAPMDSGSIAEIIIYNKLLSVDETAQVETYLDNKWGT